MLRRSADLNNYCLLLEDYEPPSLYFDYRIGSNAENQKERTVQSPNIYLVMSHPGVCESEVDCAATFPEFLEALYERLRK